MAKVIRQGLESLHGMGDHHNVLVCEIKAAARKQQSARRLLQHCREIHTVIVFYESITGPTV